MSCIDLKSGSKVPWMALLEQALGEPGMMHRAYTLFHRFSTTNGILAALQLGDKLGPIATYRQWLEKGRQVRKGEKAISLFMPVQVPLYRTDEPAAQDAAAAKSKAAGKGKKGKKGGEKYTGPTKTIFIARANWFSLAQTEGEQVPEFDPVPEWSRDQALEKLGVTIERFADPNGNVVGYCHPDRKVVAVSALAPFPLKTLFHELAHADLHSDEAQSLHGDVPSSTSVKEVEAEAVAYLVCALLGVHLDSLAYSRGYIQAWMDDPEQREAFAKTNAKRVIGCVNRIIAAGKVEAAAAAEAVAA